MIHYAHFNLCQDNHWSSWLQCKSKYYKLYWLMLNELITREHGSCVEWKWQLSCLWLSIKKGLINHWFNVKYIRLNQYVLKLQVLLNQELVFNLGKTWITCSRCCHQLVSSNYTFWIVSANYNYKSFTSITVDVIKSTTTFQFDNTNKLQITSLGTSYNKTILQMYGSLCSGTHLQHVQYYKSPTA